MAENLAPEKTRAGFVDAEKIGAGCVTEEETGAGCATFVSRAGLKVFLGT